MQAVVPATNRQDARRAFAKRQGIVLHASRPPSVEHQRETLRALVLRETLKESQIYFSRYFFRRRESVQFAIKWHHVAIARALDSVIAGKINRLLITLPPGFTKTVMLIDFLARTYARDPLSQNIMVTYNSKVARKNSRLVMDTMSLPVYRDLFEPRIRQDVSSKDLWLTEYPDSSVTNYRGNGSFLASGVDGTITSFRAGRYTPGQYSGCIAIDDPIKPKDAFNKRKRDTVNGFLNETLRSRLMLPETPIIMVMQRLHTNDPVGFCLAGGMGDYWHHLNIPVEIKKRDMKPGKRYAREHPFGIPLVYDDLIEPGFTWPEKIDAKEMAIIEKGNPIVAAAQYYQRPRLIEGNFLKGKWFRYYNELPAFQQIKRVIAICDTAFEKGNVNDRTVWTVWAETRTGQAYLLDYRGFRMEVPETTAELIKVWNRFRDNSVSKYPRISQFYVERKASGHGIIHSMVREGINVQGIERTNDKVVRAIAAVPAIIAGALVFPARNTRTIFTQNADWQEMHTELLSFTTDMTHLHDDYCDCVFDAAELFYNGSLTVGDVFG